MKLSHQEKLDEIVRLEIAISKLKVEQGANYGNNDPKILRLSRKLGKIRDSL